MIIRGQGGFTLVELMIAMAVFSFVLLIIAQGLLDTVHVQQNSMISRDAEQNARLVLDQITREAKTASDVTTPGGNAVCFNEPGGWVEYAVIPPVAPSTARVLYRQTLPAGAACPSVPVASSSAVTSSTVSVLAFTGSRIAGTPPSIGVGITVGPPDPSLLSGNACNAAVAGKQFCSVVTLNTTASMGAAQ